jgi:colanic acid/amylovoran biosynthesis glycosyltransferase
MPGAPSHAVADGGVTQRPGRGPGHSPSAGGAPRPLSVTYVTMAFPERSETFATNDVRALRAGGVQVDVQCLRTGRPDSGALLEARGLSGLEVEHNGLVATVRGILAAITRPRSAIAALRWVLTRRGGRGPRNDVVAGLLLLPRAFDIVAALERRRPDVVHMFWGHYPAIVGHLVQSRLPNVVTSISINAYDLEWEYPGTPPVARRADVVRTHAHVNLERLVPFLGIPQDHIEVIYNGIDVERVDRLGDGIVKDPLSIVAIGRLVESKGMAEVVNVFERVRRSHPGATLDIVGDGPERLSLEDLARRIGVADAVRFHGHVAHDDAVRLMWRSRVAMLLSRATGERLPNVIKEGMACGCVCVTTPTPGIEELVRHGTTGFVVQSSDVESAAAIVSDVFAGRVDGDGITERATAHVRAHFDLAKTVSRYRDIWTHAVMQRAGAPSRTRT